MKKREAGDVLILIVTPILAVLMLICIGNPFEAGYLNPIERIERNVQIAISGGVYEYNQAQFVPYNEGMEK